MDVIEVKISGSEIKSKVFFSVLYVLFFFVGAVFMPYAAEGFQGRNIAAAPDVLFALSIVMGVIYENRKAASVIALAAGVLSDIFITPPIHLSPLLFFLGAYFASKTAGVFSSIRAVTVSVSSIPFFLARGIICTVFVMSADKKAAFGSVLRTTVLPELAFNVVMVFFVYIIVSFLYKRFKRRFYI